MMTYTNQKLLLRQQPPCVARRCYPDACVTAATFTEVSIIMSWLEAASYSEDVFDENADDLSLQSKEWTTNMKKRVKDGYVEGVEAGEEASLQAGFDQGFREGAAQTAAVGRLKGIVSAIWCWCQVQHPESPPPASVTDLLQRVSQHEDAIMEGIKAALENPPPSVSSVAESMEDLEVEQAGSGCGREGCKEMDGCKKGEDADVPLQQQKLRSGSTDGSSESLNYLVKRCVDLVAELELPEDLISHIQELTDL